MLKPAATLTFKHRKQSKHPTTPTPPELPDTISGARFIGLSTDTLIDTMSDYDPSNTDRSYPKLPKHVISTAAALA